MPLGNIHKDILNLNHLVQVGFTKEWQRECRVRNVSPGPWNDLHACPPFSNLVLVAGNLKALAALTKPHYGDVCEFDLI